MRTTPRLLAVLLLLSVFTPSPHAAPPDSGLLFYEGYTFRDNTEAVNNPHIAGPLFQLYWSEIERTEGELLASKNFGQTSLNEIKKKLDVMGLTLRKK